MSIDQMKEFTEFARENNLDIAMDIIPGAGNHDSHKVYLKDESYISRGQIMEGIPSQIHYDLTCLSLFH